MMSGNFWRQNSANSEKLSSFKCGIIRLLEQENFSWLASNKRRIFKRHAYLHEVSLVILMYPPNLFIYFRRSLLRFLHNISQLSDVCHCFKIKKCDNCENTEICMRLWAYLAIQFQNFKILSNR